MTTFGIRHTADTTGRWSDYVVDSVNLLNEHLNPSGKFFYFDEVDVAQQVIGGHKVWDMYGWVIDSSSRGEFEPMWLSDVDRHAAFPAPCNRLGCAGPHHVRPCRFVRFCRHHARRTA